MILPGTPISVPNPWLECECLLSSPKYSHPHLVASRWCVVLQPLHGRSTLLVAGVGLDRGSLAGLCQGYVKNLIQNTLVSKGH